MSYDPEADAAYVTLGDAIAEGEAAQQIAFIDTPNGETQIAIDVDREGHILGFEILAASKGLRQEVLNRAIHL